MKTVFLAFMLMTCSAFSQNTEKMTDEECNEKASLLMHNTDYFKKITKGLDDRVKANGGYGFSLIMYASPFPEPGFNIGEEKVYKWTITEKYPDRNVSTVYLVYDPVTGSAYQQYMDDDTHRYYFSINASALKKCKK